MPIMTGYESARGIRAVEAERRAAYGLQLELQSLSSPPSLPSSPSLQPNARPALIIALTGFSSQKDQEMAFESGVDIFMTKPVRFREVKRLLDGWMKSRERESRGMHGGLWKEEMEKGEIDEGMSGAKRSG